MVAPGVALELKLPPYLVLWRVSAVESPWWTYTEELLTTKDVILSLAS